MATAYSPQGLPCGAHCLPRKPVVPGRWEPRHELRALTPRGQVVEPNGPAQPARDQARGAEGPGASAGRRMAQTFATLSAATSAWLPILYTLTKPEYRL